ncbi:MAG TPA: response regulator [Burkholderiales bacterium]|jgi:FixJ family two-component response regulator|nr:response regulator [Burkholderiales bacterium]
MTSDRVVYVVDDDDAVRNALRLLFHTADVEVQTFASAYAFLEQADLGRRCCLLLDIRMPELTGTDLYAELRGRGVRAPVIFITGHGDIPMAVEAMRQGAYDFIEKPFDDEKLLTQVLGALGDGRHDEPEDLSMLSARQRAVLDRVLEGKPNRQIAEELSISLKTVEFHRARIMQKLGVRTAAELFRRCLGSN